uniref:Protein kinase domain-containing protein n=1 Tax=Glossina palpalis gambiensis TaxID=67801 RepID=A0A1B0B839_9MUSC
MDVINKFYSTVHTTVAQLSGVLPGNNVTREYEILDQLCTAGVGLLWKVYNGYKKSTKQEVSVFVFEKKNLERWSREDKEAILETLRRGVQQLTKIRHPHVLTVQNPLEESRDCLAFATEPVFASLANVVGDRVQADKKLYDIEIRHGLLQLFDGLQFLHSDAKILHRNICAETVVINKNRNWKLFGFDFCVTNQPAPDGTAFWPCKEYSSAIPMMAQPCLEYCAPEIALNNINSTDSDLFSLGVLIFTIYAGKPLKVFGNDYTAYKRYAAELNQRKYPPMNALPNELMESVKALLHPSPHLRTKLHELKKISYFHDVGVKTLNYLDSLYQWDNLNKSKFYKSLPQIIPTLPHRVNLHSILPHLVKEFVNCPMIPFVLPNVLIIAEMSSQKEYSDHILTHLIPIFKLKEPIQTLLILMQKMDLLLKLTAPEEVKLHVLPLLYRSLECDMPPQIQELCLIVLPTCSDLIDYNAMKNSVIPRIKKLCVASTHVSVKVNCLISIGKLLENLDKWLVLDEILPFLQQIPCREPAVIMAIIGIYKIAMTNAKLGITKDVLANKCIPFLVPLSIECGLTVAQFNTIVTLIKEMFCRMEKEHREKLEQLNTIQRGNKPKDAAEILASELDKGSFDGKTGSCDMLPTFSINKNTKSQLTLQPSKPREQLKISYELSSNHKPDILSSLVKPNLTNISNNSPPYAALCTSLCTTAPNSVNGNVQILNYQPQTTAPTSDNNNWDQNNWHSANPLVMNHQLSPSTCIMNHQQRSTTPEQQSNNVHNNNTKHFSSLDALDPFNCCDDGTANAKHKTAANTCASKKSNVDYTYPTSYNTKTTKPISLTTMSKPLTPQASNSNISNQINQGDEHSLIALSHQDILNFLK